MKGSLFSTLILFLGLILMTRVCHCYGGGYGGGYGTQLQQRFYEGKCGGNVDVESVIFGIIKQKIASEPDTVSDLVRLSFHDCFVRVCIYLSNSTS